MIDQLVADLLKPAHVLRDANAQAVVSHQRNHGQNHARGEGEKPLGKLVRPSAIYVGPAPRSPESVEGWNEIAHGAVYLRTKA